MHRQTYDGSYDERRFALFHDNDFREIFISLLNDSVFLNLPYNYRIRFELYGETAVGTVNNENEQLTGIQQIVALNFTKRMEDGQ